MNRADLLAKSRANLLAKFPPQKEWSALDRAGQKDGLVRAFRMVIGAIKIEKREPDIWESINLADAFRCSNSGYYTEGLAALEKALAEPGTRTMMKGQSEQPTTIAALEDALKSLVARAA